MTFWQWLWPPARHRVRREEVAAAIVAAVASAEPVDFDYIRSYARLHFDYDIKLPEIWEALEGLELKGKLRRIKAYNKTKPVQAWELYDWGQGES